MASRRGAEFHAENDGEAVRYEAAQPDSFPMRVMEELGEWIEMPYTKGSIRQQRRKLIRRILAKARAEGLKTPKKRS